MLVTAPCAASTAVNATQSVASFRHTATVLPNSGKVRIAGGFSETAVGDPGGILARAEIFDPETNEVRALPDMISPRADHVAVVLADGRVLLAGGSVFANAAEVFDPITETFQLTEGMHRTRFSASATTLPSGRVLIAGGSSGPSDDSAVRNDAEIFDPTTLSFQLLSVAPGALARTDHAAALLPSGQVALFGGSTMADGDQAATERIGLISPTDAVARPRLNSVSSALATPGGSLTVTGEALASFSEVSTGNFSSPTNFPVAIWVPVEGPPTLGSFAPWSASDASWTPRSSPFHGPGLLFASRNGVIADRAAPVELAAAPLGVPCDSDLACASGFCSDGVCCNERCHVAGDPGARCRSCSVAFLATEDGVCTLVPENEDPHDDCSEESQCAANTATCGSEGQCKPCRCNSKLDCAPGFTCTAEGTCEAPLEAVPSAGCASAGRPSERSWGWCGLGLLVGILRRRQRLACRATRCAPRVAPALRYPTNVL